MPYRRLIQFGPTPQTLTHSLSDRAIAGCWFELRRWGGCSDGELRLRQEFPARSDIQIGDWVAMSYDADDRWYLGRVVERRSDSPAGIVLKLQGMSAQLDFVFPGGFGSDADGVAPHRYGCPQFFPHDPDADHENIDCVSRPEELVRRLMEQYIVPATDITFDEELIENAAIVSDLRELKVRGTESAADLLKDLALRARNAAWGVDEQGRFYFLQRRETVAADWREARDLVALRERVNDLQVFNRVLLTGGLVYAECAAPPCATFRWQGNYLQPQSIAAHGERRIRLSVPWIRTAADSQAFVREFFRVYAQPTPHYQFEVARQANLVRPWLNSVTLRDRGGNTLMTAQPEVIRVQFDHAPVFRIDLGPLSPRNWWTVDTDGDPWPVAEGAESGFGGGLVDVTSDETTDDTSEEPDDALTNCWGCATMPRRWTVTLAGLTGGVCSDCHLINGTYTLTRDSAFTGYCCWTAQHPACGGASPRNSLRLVRLPHFTGLLIITDSAWAAQYAAQEPFDCHGANTLVLDDQSPMCGNYPATLTIEPL